MTFYSFLNYVHNSYDFTDEVKEWENLSDTGQTIKIAQNILKPF